MPMRQIDLEAQLLAQASAISQGDPIAWLHERWRYLDEMSPQLYLSCAVFRALGDHRLEWVPADLIACVDAGLWGRDEVTHGTYLSITGGLLAADETTILEWTNQVGHPQLVEIPGPHGPLYAAAGYDRHRVAVLKALGVQWPYDVTPRRALEEGEELRARVNETWSAASPLRGSPQHPDVVDDWRRHLRLLADAGFLEPIGTAGAWQQPRSYVVAAALPFPWALEQPQDVAAASRRYRQSYPRFGATHAERVSLDATSWSAFLQARAESRTSGWPGVDTALVQPTQESMTRTPAS